MMSPWRLEECGCVAVCGVRSCLSYLPYVVWSSLSSADRHRKGSQQIGTTASIGALQCPTRQSKGAVLAGRQK